MTISEIEEKLELLRDECIKEKNTYLDDNLFCACGGKVGSYRYSMSDPQCCTDKKNKVRGVIEDIEAKYLPKADEYKIEIIRLEKLASEKRRNREIDDKGFQASIGIPPKYHGANLDDSGFKAEIDKWYRYQRGFLTLTGKAGTGKTRTIYALLRRLYVLYPDKKTPKVWSVPEFTKEIQSYHYADSAWQEIKLINRMSGTENLVIFDDLGAEKLTEATRQNLFIIIKKREEWERLTLVTTNLTIKEIAETIDDRIASRLAGGIILKYTGNDRRLDK